MYSVVATNYVRAVRCWFEAECTFTVQFEFQWCVADVHQPARVGRKQRVGRGRDRLAWRQNGWDHVAAVEVDSDLQPNQTSIKGRSTKIERDREQTIANRN